MKGNLFIFLGNLLFCLNVLSAVEHNFVIKNLDHEASTATLFSHVLASTYEQGLRILSKNGLPDLP